MPQQQEPTILTQPEIARAHGMLTLIHEAPHAAALTLLVNDMREWLDEHTPPHLIQPCLLHRMRHYLRPDCEHYIASWRYNHDHLRDLSIPDIVESPTYKGAYAARTRP